MLAIDDHGLTRSRRALATLVALALLVGIPAGAGQPGNWTKITESATGGSTFEVGTAVTGDGVLHLVWVRNSPNGSGNQDLMHTAIAPEGSKIRKNAIVTGWNHILFTPALVTTPNGGLRVFFSGGKTANSGEPNFGVNTAASDATGVDWTLQSGTAAPGTVEINGDLSATVGTDGTFYQAGGSVFVHRGLSPSTPNYDYQAQLGGCCGYGASLVTDDNTGEIWLVWYSSAPQNKGVWAQEVDQATGAPVGSPLNMPGSVTTYNGEPQSIQPTGRIPVAARVGGGIYVMFAAGYPAANKALVWRIGDSSSKVLGRGGDMGAVTIASTLEGRIWTFWGRATLGRPRIHYVISNSPATEWSPETSISTEKDPTGFAEIHTLQSLVRMQRRVDILAYIGSGGGTQATFHTQISKPPDWTDGANSWTGTFADELAYTAGGNDRIDGGGGRDRLYGAGGDDLLIGGAGKDFISGGAGTDTCKVTEGDKTTGCENLIRNR